MKKFKSISNKKLLIILFFVGIVLIGEIYDVSENFHAFPIEIKISLFIILFVSFILSLIPRFRIPTQTLPLSIILCVLLLISLLGTFYHYYNNYVYSNWDNLKKQEMKKIANEVGQNFKTVMNFIRSETLAYGNNQKLLNLIGQEEGPLKQKEMFNVLKQALKNRKLPAYGFGLSLYSSSGQSIAWFGETKPFGSGEFSLEDTSEELIFVYKGFVSTWLNVLLPIKNWEGEILGYVLGQFLLESHYGSWGDYVPGRNHFFPPTSAHKERLSIDFYDFREEQEELKSTFERYGTYFWSRSQREGESLFYPFYGFNGDILGVLTVASLTREAYVNRLGSILQSTAAFLLIIIIIWLTALQLKSYLSFLKKDEKLSFAKWIAKFITSFFILISLLWIIRWLFIKLNFPLNLKSFQIFDPKYFALKGPLNMMKSPADFLLTSFFLFIGTILSGLLIWQLGQRIKHLNHLSKKRFRKENLRALKLFSSFILALAIAGLLLLFNQFLKQITFNSGTKLVIFSLEPPYMPRFCLEIGLHFISLSLLVVIFSIFYIFALINSKDKNLIPPLNRLVFFILTIILILLLPYKISFFYLIGTTIFLLISASFTFYFLKILDWFKRSSLLARTTIIYLLLLSAILLYYPAIYDYLDNSKSNFVQEEIIPLIRSQKEWGSFLLHQSFSTIEQSKRLKDELKSRSIESRGIAYSFWREIGFASAEFNSSLVVFDSQGNILDIFSFYIPHIQAEKLENLQQYIKPVIETKWLHYGSQEIGVIQGIKAIIDDGKIIGAVIASVSIGYDNLAFVHSQDPYYEIFRPKGYSCPEHLLFNDELFLLAYEWDGRIRYSSTSKGLPLDNNILGKLRNSEQLIWKRVAFGGEHYRLVHFKSMDYPLAVGYPQNSFKDYLFSFTGLIVVNALVFLSLAAIFALYKISEGNFRFGRLNPWKGIISSFYRKLLSLLILISIIPMIFLSLSIKNYLSDRLIRQIREEGVATAYFAKRVMEDYLFVQEKEWGKPEELIDDNLALLISSWVNRDIHIFFGDSLIATNKRELYSSELISPRTYDETYYQLVLSKQPHFASQLKLGKFKYIVISVPIELSNINKPTILSIPLMFEQRQVNIEIAEINDAILIATVILVIFCAALSYSIAKKVSDPIKKLTLSTYQISDGNFDLKVATDSKDEMKELVESFNRMSQNLKKQRITLRERKEYIEKILLNATTGVLSLDNKGVITTINPAAITLLLLKKKKLIGKPLLKLVAYSRGLREFRNSLKEFLNKPRLQLIREIQVRHFNQQTNLRVKFISLIELGIGITGFIILLEDITEIIKSNRLATWAEMARIIAHEIKNPLTPIQLSAEHLQQIIKDQPPGYSEIIDACIKSILQQVNILRQLSTEFSNYAKIPQLKLSKVDVGELINYIIESYSSLKQDKFEVKTEIAEDLTPIQGDKELLRRVLTNIIENSLEAMPQGGRLTIKADSSISQNHKGVSIEVIDTGIGIDKKTIRRLFEPYFSTKDSGVGLGLAITKKAIEEHQGKIKVKSTKGKGTNVIIWLPAEK